MDGYHILRCAQCGLGRVENPPSPEALAALYDEAYFESAEAVGYQGYAEAEDRKRQHFRTLLDEIARERGVGSPGRLVEIGCAYGFFLDEARKRGWSVMGLEPSAHAAGRARDHLGLDVRSDADALARLPDGEADVVAAWDVIEHVAEPLGLMASAHRLLREGGVLALSTGDVGSLSARLHGRHWSLVTPPWHLWYFTRRSMAKLLEAQGFQVTRLGGDGCVARDPGARQQRLPAWVGRLLGAGLLVRGFRRLGLGQIMYVFARKTGKREVPS